MPYSRTPLGEIVKKINDSTGVCEELVDSSGASLSSVFLTPPQVASTQALVSGAWNCDVSGSSAAAANSSGIQAALDAVALLAGGGVVNVLGRGRAYCTPLRIPSGCRLNVESGLTLVRSDSVHAPLLRNKYGGQKNKADRFNRSANVVTVNNRYHGMGVGQSVWVGSLTDTTMSGIQTIASVPDAHSWTYASTGTNGAGGAATVFGDIIPLQRTLAGASLVAASNVVTVSDPGHDLRPGMNVWLGTSGASTAFAGVVEVIAVWADNWQYVTASAGTGAATGTFGLSYDRDIAISGGGSIDGNPLNNGTLQDVDLMLSLAVFGMVNQSSVTVKRMTGTIFRVLCFYNAADVTVAGVEVGDTLVGVQWEGSAKRTLTTNMRGGTSKWVSGAQLLDDMVAYTGTKTVGGQAYDSTVSPYGLGAFLNNKASSIYAPNCLNGVKLTADSTVTIDNLVIEDVSGGMLNNNVTPLGGSTAAVRMVDDTAGLLGMVCGSIYIRRVNWFGGAAAVLWASSGTAKLIEVDGVGYGPNAQQSLSNTTSVVAFYGVTNANGRIKRLAVKNINNVSAGASKPSVILGSGNVKATNTIQIDEFDLDAFELTPNTNASGAAVIKYGNCTVLSARVGKGVFLGPSGLTGHCVVCYGPDNMGRWTFDGTRVATGGGAMSFVMTIAVSDQTVCAGEVVFKACDLTSASGIFDNATAWSGTLTVRMSDTKAVFTGNLLNLAAATALTVLHASPTVTTTADKVAGTLAGTLRVNGPSIQLVGSKVTAPQPGDIFWSTDTSTTGSASIGMKARTNAGAWAALF